MSNCSNLSSTQTVSLTAGTLPATFCHTSLQSTYEEFITRTTVSVGNPYIVGDDTPSAQETDKLWFRQDPNTCQPMGWHWYDPTANSGVGAWEPVFQMPRTAPPIGSIMMWPTATPPTDWLICDGGTFSATDYPDLNTLLGGNTLPDFKGRMPMGAGQGSTAEGGGTGTSRALGDTGGAETHTLTTDQIPSHSHTQRGGGFNGSVGIESGNQLTANLGETGSTGGGQSHPNIGPFLVTNFIICAK